MKPLTLLWIFFLFAGRIELAYTQTNIDFKNRSFTSLNDHKIDFEKISKESITAFFFLSPECPLCENYSLTINQLRKKYPSKNIVFYGVFPGKFFSKEEIQAYMTKYKVEVTVLLDPEYELRDLFQASVTPEVYLVKGSGELLYKGAIDNWIPALGKKRTIINKHYLNDAIVAALEGKPIAISETKAIGCFIE